MRGFVRLESGIAQDDDEALRVFVVCGDGGVLLGDKLGELGRRHGLGSCQWEGHVSIAARRRARGREVVQRGVRLPTYLHASFPVRASRGTPAAPASPWSWLPA